MSNLLDDALVDAEALRETALKNAESILLEKFSDQIKNAVETILLEQPEDEMPEEDPLAADPMADEEPAEPAEEVPDAPLANAEGVEMCPCPDEEEVVTIDFDELERQVDALEADEEMPSEEAAEEMPLGLEETLEIDVDILQEVAGNVDTVSIEEELLEELAETLEEDFFSDSASEESAEAQQAGVAPHITGPGLSAEEDPTAQYSTTAAAPTNESREINEENILEELIEALNVDIDPLKTEKSGWMNTPQGTFQLAEEELLAMLQDSEKREKHEEMAKALKKLEESNTNLSNTVTKLSADKKEILSLSRKMKNKLQESNLTNSKLLYSNKVLMSDSLNERQKTKIVEALSNAETVEETKTIYETLQSATGTTIKKKMPESLSEAVSKTTSTLILSHRKRGEKESAQNDSSVERWKILAGLNNKQ